MKKNILKTLLQVTVTAAMVVTVFIGGGNSAKACEYCDGDPEYHKFVEAHRIVAERHGYTFEQMWNDWELSDKYHEEIHIAAGDFANHEEYAAWMEEVNTVVNNFFNGNANSDIYKELATQHTKMLSRVNADRAKYGAGKLTWSADLEKIANQRAVAIMSNAQSEEYANAMLTGNYTKQAEVIHSGSVEGLGENAHVAYYTGVSEEKANNAWIASEGHHAIRITAGYTQYACASYTDPITGMETWVELFADDSYLASHPTFDYMRYAAENPDVAAVVGQDRDALYSHYITFGAEEGRKAYLTDGTEFGTQEI